MDTTSYRPTLVLAGLLVLSSFVFSKSAEACPFCNAVGQTLSEEVMAADVAITAELVERPREEDALQVTPDADPEGAKATLRIIKIFKGKEFLEDTKEIRAIYFGDAPVGTTMLVFGIHPPEYDTNQWATPIKLTERAVDYLDQLLVLPSDPAKRLLFFMDYLQDSEDMLQRDAYDEFARAPYDTIKLIKDQIPHDELVGWIQDPETAKIRRRLYFTMLGVCGSEADLPLLEAMLQSGDPKQREGLDSLVACYLTLGGPEKLDLIDDLFFKSSDKEYTETYSAVMALRFLGQEADIVPRERLLESLRHLLNRPQLADLVIPDLARWEDWGSIDRLVKLFLESDKETSWVRVPVVKFLRACPLPEAKAKLEELKQFDAESVKRGMMFYPFAKAPAVADAAGDKSDEEAVAKNEAAAPGKIKTIVAPTDVESGSDAEEASEAVEETAALPPNSAEASGVKAQTEAEASNLSLVIGVAGLAGVLLVVVFWIILRGPRQTARV